MNDRATPLQEIKDVVRQFVTERDWSQFHSPKNLSMALSVEASELMEIFQWVETDISRDVDAMGQRKQVEEELADIFCYTLAIANELDIDLASAFQQKMIKNRQKYPAETFKGVYGKDDPKLKASQ